MSEPLAAAIDAVFAQMTLTYGAQRIEGFYRGQDAEVVKRFWLHTLRGMSPVDVLYALDHLPAEGVPNVLQFKALALKRPMPAFPLLPHYGAYEPDHEAIARVRKAIEPLRVPKDPRAWIAALQAREHLTRYQQECLDEALGRTGKTE